MCEEAFATHHSAAKSSHSDPACNQARLAYAATEGSERRMSQRFYPDNMNSIEMLHQKEVSLLEAIHRNPNASQRVLSKIISLSLGQTNALMKTLIDKGDLEISRGNGRTIKYLITKRGYGRWMRYTSVKLSQSFHHICDVKRIIGKRFDCLFEKGVREFVMEGENDVIAAIVGEVFRETIGEQGKLVWGSTKSGKDQVLLRLNAIDEPTDESTVHVLYELANAG